MKNLSNRRIVLTIPNIEIGGSELIAIKYLKACTELRLDTSMLVLNSTSKDFNLTDKIIKFEEKNLKNLLINPSKLLKFITELNKYDTIISFIDHYSLFICFLKSTRLIKKNTKLITRISSDLKKNKIASGFEWFDNIVYRLFFKCSYLIILQSKSSEVFFQERLRLNNCVVINNPFLNSAYKNEKMSKIFDFIYVANFRKEKNHIQLISIFQRIISKSNNNNLSLCLVGDGPETRNIKNYIKSLGLVNNIYLMGSVPQPSTFIDQSKVFLFPSKSEGYPNAVIESIFNNVPVVGFKECEVLQEIIIHGSLGFLSNNEQEFVENALKALEFSINEKDQNELKDKHDWHNFKLKISSILNP